MNKTLVNYSSSSDDETADNPNSKKIKSEIPAKITLPNYLRSAADTKVESNPNKHKGRIRSFPHERGNWPTHVYSKGPDNDILHMIYSQLKIFIDREIPEIKSNVVDHFHVSLTRTVVIQHHWIDSFTKSIRDQLSFVNKFFFNLASVQIYCNDDCTRTFIGLAVDAETSEYFKNIVNILNEILLDFKLPEFYTNPSFHMSILWCLGNQKLILANYLDEMNRIFRNVLNSSDEVINANSNNDFIFFVSQLYCKIGNKLFAFDLS